MIRTLGILLALAFAAAVGFSTPTANADAFNICPSGLTAVATPDTSCAFAENVRTARIDQPGPTVMAYSPVTQQSYSMQCTPTVTDLWPNAERCLGVNSYGVTLIVLLNMSANDSGSAGQTTNGQAADSSPYVGGDADSPYIPNLDSPNIGCTWVNGYTRKNGTQVSGHWRC